MRRDYDIRPTVLELAAEFCKLDEEARVEFLVEVAREIESYGNTYAAAWMLDTATKIREAGGLAEKLVSAWAGPSESVAREKP